MIFPFPQGGMLLWRIPSEPMPPWPPQLPPCAVCWSHVTNYWAQSALGLKRNVTKATFFGGKSPGWKLENPTKTEIPLCKSEISKWKSVSLMGFVYINDLHIVIRPDSGIKFPTPNIIPKNCLLFSNGSVKNLHANLHSRLLISSISRFSHSFSKYQGNEKVCKQFCWSLQIRPSCFWKGVKTLPNDFAGSNSKNLKYIMR